MEKQRYVVLDVLRGLTLLSMMIYHGIWNIVHIFGQPWAWYKSEAGYWWQQSICWSFILLSGFCWQLGRKKWKRGVMVLLAGQLVSLVTFVSMPERVVRFGILTCLGSCMLLMVALHPLFRNRNPILGSIVSFGLFLLTRNIRKGSIGLGAWRLAELPENWYANMFTAYLGCPPGTFFSIDYFALFPWFFLFLTGYFIYMLTEQKGLLPYLHLQVHTPLYKPFEWLGKRSMMIYLLHQPIIYGVMCLYYSL